MSLPLNTFQLVLRRDLATGWTKVDWASHLPLGRFSHIDTICESTSICPISETNPLFADYQRACRQARTLNAPLLAEQQQDNLSRHWLPIPLSLNDPTVNTGPDDFGNYLANASQAFYRLCANIAEASQ